MKKSILSLIILSVITFSQNVNYTVNGQTNKSKSAVDISKSVKKADPKSMKLPSAKATNENFTVGTLVYDGRTYNTVTINGKEWMSENLAYLPMVMFPTSGSIYDHRYYVYDFSGNEVSLAKQNANYTTYGVLYNWRAAKAACPPGWHLPSDEEWTALEEYLIANGYNFDGTTIDDKVAKSLAAGVKWNADSIAGSIGKNLSLNNKSGFSALPGGYRMNVGVFGWMGEYGFWWSSTEHSAEIAWSRCLFYNHSDIRRMYSFKESGFSVRCVKD